MRGFFASLLSLFLLPVVPALADDAPRRLSGEDLSVQTHKWDGKRIQATMQCFYADKDEYRCLVGINGPTVVRVDFRDIEPASMKKTLEDKCDTKAKSQSRACRVQATFTYSGNDRTERATGTILMFIIAEGAKATLAPAK